MPNPNHNDLLEEKNDQEHFMKEHDMVFSRSKDGTITGGGFVLESMLLKNITEYGEHPDDDEDNMIGGDNTHKNMNTMAVPFGLFYKQEKNLHKNQHKNFNNSPAVDVNNDNEISDDLYNELLKKVNANDNSYEKSKKNNKSEKKKSRKNSNQLNHKKTAKSIHTYR